MSESNHLPQYCQSLFKYERFKTCNIKAGNVIIGADYPVRLQSMTTTNTLNTKETAEQCIRVYKAGGKLVRITTQGRREAENLKAIKEEISSKGYNFPLVADIHFNPNAAEIAAQIVDKVRINPGNFAGGAKKFELENISNEMFSQGLSEIKKKLIPFLEICKKNNTAIRIGANHGSLSDRIMAKYGDTPEGMVASIMEYLKICRENDFNNIVLSIKSSNTRVMVHTVRLLAATMIQEKMNYPLHLGVTEAGAGEDGRIKSAVGIGALLADGLGDTIRVSLTEDPEAEIPVARELKEHFEALENHQPIEPTSTGHYSPFSYKKRESMTVGCAGGEKPAMVIADLRESVVSGECKIAPEAYITNDPQLIVPENWKDCVKIIPYTKAEVSDNTWPLFKIDDLDKIKDGNVTILELTYNELNTKCIEILKKQNNIIVLLTTDHQNGIAEQRAFFLTLQHHGINHPVIIHRKYKNTTIEKTQIIAAADMGLLFLDGYGDGISINANDLTTPELIDLQFGILQASRVRFSKTEYISCPGCGRTLFDLQSTTKMVQEKTGHLKGLKIAVMGCIVNGIGEMADADYGYVGAGPGKISLFRKRELIKKSIPEKDAVAELISLIKENGDWVNPEN
ncbi:(E)-4-hydroxy-3-methylbut-2-enyl-diphosphate synthase [Alkalitalea saponilacus]|uniref:4-hydroxy-3-methylbut-2-en-1-yl diphosphate synthase (flavodoxin) n=1 Tax=Alkalitalea saponilacus TaxID=889453 RepID=A0A1T5A111_9BACT|nr:(E)-4-hydroxy-3-methylbut-2-enyl-diphosphate synthase [Alkalitalea saponilacus]ASB48920.1 4-hydroxy-3-methylbut-2-en-1-yl diphosphate synthase [Alkalitalea saponilacus]SKB28640.1 4-hydroxy-3-methylbut-2-en-1-yl diphosphate synthase [Alkalitalea saponilacus]